MSIVALLFLVLVGAAVGYLMVQVIRERRTPPELGSDRWTAFEREFRAYAERAAHNPRDRCRQREQRGPTRP